MGTLTRRREFEGDGTSRIFVVAVPDDHVAVRMCVEHEDLVIESINGTSGDVRVVFDEAPGHGVPFAVLVELAARADYVPRVTHTETVKADGAPVPHELIAALERLIQTRAIIAYGSFAANEILNEAVLHAAALRRLFARVDSKLGDANNLAREARPQTTLFGAPAAPRNCLPRGSVGYYLENGETADLDAPLPSGVEVSLVDPSLPGPFKSNLDAPQIKCIKNRPRGEDLTYRLGTHMFPHQAKILRDLAEDKGEVFADVLARFTRAGRRMKMSGFDFSSVGLSNSMTASADLSYDKDGVPHLSNVEVTEASRHRDKTMGVLHDAESARRFECDRQFMSVPDEKFVVEAWGGGGGGAPKEHEGPSPDYGIPSMPWEQPVAVSDASNPAVAALSGLPGGPYDWAAMLDAEWETLGHNKLTSTLYIDRRLWDFDARLRESVRETEDERYMLWGHYVVVADTGGSLVLSLLPIPDDSPDAFAGYPDLASLLP